MSKQKESLLFVYNRGYRVIENVTYSPKGKIIKGTVTNRGYRKFSIRMNGSTYAIPIHRLVGYQKYGDKIFEADMEIRHLNCDSLCNYDWNIGIGTHQDNMMDKSKELRFQAAMLATSYIKVHDHDNIIKYRQEGHTYRQIMEKFNISSKGSVAFIILHSHSANKDK